MTPSVDELEAIFAKSEKSGFRISTMSDVAGDIQWLTTGNIAIDYAMNGGIPMGRCVELYGPPSSGKTTCAFQTAIELQKVIKAGGDPARGIGPNDIILYLDYEQTASLEYAMALGLDVEHPSFRFGQPDTLEEGMDIALATIKTGRVRLVIVDSVAAMVPSAQAEEESVGKNGAVALAARLLKKTGQNLNPVLRKNNCSMIWINHEVEVMSMGGPASYGPPPTSTPGGKSIKFFASVRVQFRQIKQHKGPFTDRLTGEVKEIPLMTDVRVKCMKNKVGNPFQEAVVRVRFGRGFDPLWTAMQILTAAKLVVVGTGKRYYFEKLESRLPAPEWMPREAKSTARPTLHGEKTLFKMADLHPEWQAAMVKVAAEVAAENEESLKAQSLVDEPDEDEETPLELDDLLGSDAEPTSGGRRVKI